MIRRDVTAVAIVKIHLLTGETRDESRVRRLIVIIAVTLVVKRVDNVVAIDTKINSHVIIIRLNGVGEEIESVDGAAESLVVKVTANIRFCAVKQDAVSRVVIFAAVRVGGETNLRGCWSLFCKKDNEK